MPLLAANVGYGAPRTGMQRLLVALLCLVLAFSFGCSAIPERPAEAPRPEAKRYYDAIDWKRAGDEASQWLAGYLRVDTYNPPGNETRGAEYLGKILEREKIPYEILEYGPGRGNLIARLPGSGLEPPLCLLSHIDVVSAEAEKWPAGKGPLSGTIDDKGNIWGRGALDMKGMGILELMTMVWLKRLNVPLKRTIILLAVAAEESDSGGMRFMVDQHWGKIGCSHSINEGGIGIKELLMPGQTVYSISVAEKGVLWLRMTAHGEAGAGSTPIPDRAPEHLFRAIDKLNAREAEPVIHPAMYELMARVGRDVGGLKGFILARPSLVRMFVIGKLMDNPVAKATLIDTINITGVDGMKEPNVVPSEMSAILDCRLLPGTRPIDFLFELERLVNDPKVTFELIESMNGNESPWQDPLFHALSTHAVDGRPGVVAGPVLSPGYTDSLFLRLKGVRAYGLNPFEVDRFELATFHGRDERVSVENMRRGLKVLFRSVLDVSAK